jgi:hypothetical protein
MIPMNKYNNINAKFRISDGFTASDRSFYGKVQASSGKGIRVSEGQNHKG